MTQKISVCAPRINGRQERELKALGYHIRGTNERLCWWHLEVEDDSDWAYDFDNHLESWWYCRGHYESAMIAVHMDRQFAEDEAKAMAQQAKDDTGSEETNRQIGWRSDT